MASQKDAQEFLSKLRCCRPQSFFGKVDECQRGTGFILAYLEEVSGEVIAGDLARELNVSTARIAALLKTMEKNELIIRYQSATDNRQTVVEITQKGIDYSAAMKKQILEKAELLLEKVGKEELDEFIRISMKIKEALDE
ncbi:MAG: MarR family transcriptional regulator [Acetatifactor sp.]|nr:MarR family transcriptional regulator [Acetatifactor sp.]